MLVSALMVPWFAVCAVLATAGVAKVRRPQPTVGALASARLPGGQIAVRALGVGELLLGNLGLVTGQRLVPAAVSALYLAFAVFVARALRGGTDLQTCGCFGTPDVPATRLHLGVTAGAAAVALAVAVGNGAATVDDVLAEGAAGVAVLALAGAAALEVVIILAVLPLVHGARLHRPQVAAW